MRGKIIGGVWLILTIASLGWMLQQWQEISNYSNQLGLRYESGILSKEAIEGYYEKHPTDSLQITAWDQIENQQVRELKLDRKSVADVYQVSGNMALLFPM